MVAVGVRRRKAPIEISKMSLFYLILLLYLVMSATPFLWSILTSFKTLGEANANSSILPNHPTLSAWQQVLTAADFPRWFLNSVIVAGLITVANLFFDSLAGYTFARMRFPGKTVLFYVILGTTMVPAAMTIVPIYIILAKVPTGPWVATYQGLVVPFMVSAFGIFMMRQFFMALPIELEEAAKLDGLGRFGIYWRIALPLARPALATLAILQFQGSWDSFLFPLFITGGVTSMLTLPVGLANYNFLYIHLWPEMMAGSMIVILPVLVIYIFAQRYFIEGLSRSGIKG